MSNIVATNYIGEITWDRASNATISMNEIPKNKNKNPPARMPIKKKEDKLMFFFTGLKKSPQHKGKSFRMQLLLLRCNVAEKQYFRHKKLNFL